MDKMSLIDRLKAKSPKFFRILKMIGMGLAAAGAALLAAPIALPAGLVTFGGYLIVGGTVATAVAQTTVEEEGNNF